MWKIYIGVAKTHQGTLFIMLHTSTPKATDALSGEQTGTVSSHTRIIPPLALIIEQSCFPSVFKLFGFCWNLQHVASCFALWRNDTEFVSCWIPQLEAACRDLCLCFGDATPPLSCTPPPVCNTSLITSFHFEVAFLICVPSWMFVITLCIW